MNNGLCEQGSPWGNATLVCRRLLPSFVSIPLAPGPPALSLLPLQPSPQPSSSSHCGNPSHPFCSPVLRPRPPAWKVCPALPALSSPSLNAIIARTCTSQKTHLPHVPADTWVAPPSMCQHSECQGRKSFPRTALNGPPWRLSDRESACRCRRPGFDPWVEKIPWRRKRQPTPVLSPGKTWTEEPGGLQSLGSERDTTERLNSSSKPPCPQPQRRCCSDPWSPVRTPGPHVPG